MSIKNEYAVRWLWVDDISGNFITYKVDSAERAITAAAAIDSVPDLEAHAVWRPTIRTGFFRRKAEWSIL